MSDARVLSPSNLVGLLAPALGAEKAAQCVSRAAASVGLTGKQWTAEEAMKVLDAIAYAGGDAGVAAAQARSQLVARDTDGEAHTPSGGARRRAATPAKRTHYTRRDLAVMLARTLGQEKAVEVIDAAARTLAIPLGDLTAADALRILERLATAEGMVGVAARFAKSRVLLGS